VTSAGRRLPLPLALAFCVCIWLVAPSVAWFDSGELAATAVELGVPHPSGFALFNLLGHATSRLPLGPAALRVHLLGAFAALGAVWLWRRALTQNSAETAVAWPIETALLLLPLTQPALLLHVRATEVYPLVWLTAATALWVAARLPLGRAVVALGLLCGLGAGVHVEALLLPALLFAWGTGTLARRSGLRRAAHAGMSATVLAGLAAVAVVYLPLAAGRPAAFSWGDVRSLPTLLDHLTGASIRAAFGDQIGGAFGWQALGRLVWRNAAWLLGPALLGVAVCWRTAGPDAAKVPGVLLPTRAAVAAASSVLLLADAVYSAVVNPMGLRDEQAGLVLLLGLGVLAGLGLQALAVRLREVTGRPGAAGGALAICLLTGVLGMQSLQARPREDLWAAARLADEVWRDVPPGALVVTGSDHLASACAWTAAGEGVRPDVLCLPGVFARSPRMLAAIARRGERPGFDAAAARASIGSPAHEVLAGWLRPEVAENAVAWELGNADEDALVASHLHAGLPWGRLGAEPVTPGERALEAQVLVAKAQTLCATLSPQAPWCGLAPTLAGHVGHALGLHAAARLGRPGARPGDQGARLLLDQAHRLAPENPRILNNLAVLELADGHAIQALDLCERALASEPGYARAHRTGARAAVRAGLAEVALAHARAYVEARPREARAWLAEVAREAEPGLAARLRGLGRVE